VYREGTHKGELHRICEQLVDVDHAFQWWLGAHLLLVRRTIGVDTSVVALDGMPTKALVARSFKPLFRQLWQVRVELTAQWNRGTGYGPGEDRAAPPPPLREGEGGR
jgi:tryptophan 2,3-dioxygenase